MLNSKYGKKVIVAFLLLVFIVFYSQRSSGPLGNTEIGCARNNTWTQSIKNQRIKNYSQYFQDGFLRYILEHIGESNRFYVEFGYGYGANVTYAQMGTNSYNLFSQGWSGVMFDVAYADPSINLYQEKLSMENIVSVFEKHRVPYDVDFVSIDVDSIDYWLTKALLDPKSPYIPRVLCIETNPNFPIYSMLGHKKDWTPWKRFLTYGTALYPLYQILKEKYTLVTFYHDSWWVRTDILKGCSLESYEKVASHLPYHSWNKLTKEVADKMELIDIQVFFDSGGDERKAGLAALEFMKNATREGIFEYFDKSYEI